MIKLETILDAYIVDDKYYHTDGTTLLVNNVPTNIAYKQQDGGTESFFTSVGWTGAREYVITYDEWKRSCNYPFPYLTHLYIKSPELARTGALNRAPKMFYFDIEVASDGSGRFPRSDIDPMIMFGYAVDDGETHVHYVSDLHKRPRGLEDRELVKLFIDCVVKENPDIIVSYNGWSFDIPYIITRARILGIDIKPLLRTNVDSIQHIVDHQLNAEMVAGNLGSRVHYDIFNVDVLKDQKLSGIKDRKMKTVGKHFLKGMADDIVELEDGIHNLRQKMMSQDGITELIAYQKSDVMVTRGLAKVYFPLSIVAANELGMPLNMIINRSNGTLASIHTLKQMLPERIIPDKSNEDLYPTLYSLIEKNGETNRHIKKAYQGAYVDLYKSGKFDKIWKVDFSSLYPSILITFNLSYETVHFNPSEMSPIKTDRDNCWKEFTYQTLPHELLLHIPDFNFLRILNVSIDTGVLGRLPAVLAEELARRRAVRAEMKTLDKTSVEYAILDSRQNFYKVLANSTYGLLGSRFSIGYLPIGFTITGVGRHLIRKAIELISDPKYNICPTSKDTKGELWSDEWRKTNPVVEIDTDGVLLTSEPDVAKLNYQLTLYIKEAFGLDNKYLQLEKEEFGMGYIRAMKNYAVLKPGEKEPVVHGSFFKSSRAALVVDRAVKLLINHLLFNQLTPEEVITKALNLDDDPFESFKQKVKMSKGSSSYKMASETHRIMLDGVETEIHEKGDKADSQMLVKLADMYKDSYGYTPQKGDILDYVTVREVTTGLRAQIPFNKLRASSMFILDKEYYREIILNLLQPILPQKKREDTFETLLEF